MKRFLKNNLLAVQFFSFVIITLLATVATNANIVVGLLSGFGISMYSLPLYVKMYCNDV